MIKEVIQGEIDILFKLGMVDNHTDQLIQDIIDSLCKQLQQTKSIEDIKIEEYQRGFIDAMEQHKQVMLENMKKAFEAGYNYGYDETEYPGNFERDYKDYISKK